MPQRPEDYQSTKNVGGNKLGGTDAGHNDPFSYLKIKPEHIYFGHFRQEKFLREGHNVRRGRKQVVATAPGGKVVVGRPAGTTFKVKSADALSRRTARRAIKAGGETGAAVAAERPVLAARLAAREAGASRKERRAMVREARKAPGSFRSEHGRRRRAGMSSASSY